MIPSLTILQGDAASVLATLPEQSVQCIVTSPPYFGLRDYKVGGQIGLEPTPAEYIAKLVAVFAECRRVLKDDGTLWLNMGDSYANDGKWGGQTGGKHVRALHGTPVGRNKRYTGLAPKCLMMIPARLAIAMCDDGWILRSEIIWAKPNPMPESCEDRPTCSHEKIFMFAKQAKYLFESCSVRNPPSPALLQQIAEGYNGHSTKDFEGALVQNASAVKNRIIEGARKRINKQRGHGRRHDGFNDRWDHLSREEQMACGSNIRNVWSIAASNLKQEHYASFPPMIPRLCILAGTRPGDTVMDCFLGSGTTAMVANELGRNAIGIELNKEYVEIAKRRCHVTPGLPI